MAPEIVLEIAQVLWRNYSEADKKCSAVAREKNDGSPDWPLFHGVRVRNARDARTIALTLYNEFTAHFSKEMKEIQDFVK